MRVSRRRRSPLVVAAAVLAVLAGAELATRAIDEHLPPPLVWHSFEAQKKVAQMDRLGDAGGADVVFVGTSMMHAAVDPVVVGPLLGDGLTAYNASLSSSIPRQTERWMFDVVLPRLRPKLVVLGVTSFEFTDLGHARTGFYDAFIDSRGAKRAMDLESTLDHVDRWLRARSAFWNHRFELRRPKELVNALRRKTPQQTAEVEAVTPLGYWPFLANQPYARGIRVDVSKWRPGGKDAAALERLVRGVQARGIKVALVQMPVTEDYVGRHPHRQADFDRFESLLEDLGRRTGAPVIAPPVGRDQKLFADEVHLNGRGAATFMDLLIPALRSNGLLPAS